MILQIEKWVERTHPFDPTSSDLFQESVQCYKAGAYRAAFLLSYLAFESVVKFKCLHFGDVPDNVPKEKWSNHLKKINNSDTWEEGVSDILLTSPPNNTNKGATEEAVDCRVVKIKDHQVFADSFRTWRHTRNSCAHAKEIITIDASTVECFWNFIKDNIFKLQISGGYDYWIDVIFKSFRDRREVIAPTYEQYLDALATSHMSEDDLQEIWKEINILIDNLSFLDISDKKEFWAYIYHHSRLQDSFIKYLKNSLDVFCEFYEYMPEILDFIFALEDGVTFRNDELIPWIQKYYKNYYIESVFWDIVLNICKNIKGEAEVKRFLKGIRLEALKIELRSEQQKLLKQYGFFDLKKQELELKYDYDKAPNQLDNINETLLVLNNIEFDKDVVSSLNWYVEGLSSHHYPFIDRLYNKIKKNLSNEAIQQIQNIAKEEELELKGFLDSIE